MATYDPYLEKIFPKIKNEGYDVTSPIDPRYNCFAWAAENNKLWYEPDYNYIGYWPVNIAREYTIDALINLYQSLGYDICENGELEKNYEKIAIYIDVNNIPQHAARQLDSGAWTSKLGVDKDIQHKTLEGLEGSSYGNVGVILKRQKRKTKNK